MATSPANEPFVFEPSAPRGRLTGGADRHSAGGPNLESASGRRDSSHQPPLVDQTRREIANILREIANQSRQEIPVDVFVRFLCDRTLRAMAAEGVVIWKVQTQTADSSQFEPIARLGRVTDQTFSPSSQAAHRRLLQEVIQQGEPVVVPATPGATDQGVPANPTDVPAALVCVGSNASEISSATPGYVIEVFLEPEGGMATQRGYLRFVAQVADLAGEYFREERLRTLISQHELAEQSDTAIHAVHRAESFAIAANQLVDSVAEVFQFARVALCDTAGRGRVIAVSHVDSIDHRSAAVNSMIAAANELADDVALWTDRPDPNQPVQAQSEDSQLEDPPREGNELEILAVLGAWQSGSKESSLSQYRIVALDRPNSQTLPPYLHPHGKRELGRLIAHAVQSLDDRFKSKHLAILNRIPVAIRQITTAAVACSTIGLVCLIPVPRNVDATGTLRPLSMMRITATRDAIVDQIHVDHGQSVRRGDLLLSLVDPALEEKVTSLVGRRAVLAQQRASLTDTIVDSSSRDFDQIEQVQGRRSIVEQEIASVDQQMRLLRELRESLEIRSDRDGTVDAWQIRERLADRPIHRGEPLLQIIDTETDWMVDARVSQNRVESLRQSFDEDHLTASVTVHDQPDQILAARLQQFGPVLGGDNATTNAGLSNTHGNQVSVTLQLTTPNEIKSANRNHLGLQNESPAFVVFHCGETTIGEFFFGDLCRSLVRRFRLHIADTSTGDATVISSNDQ